MAWRHPLERKRDVERARALYLEYRNITRVAREMGLPRSTVSDYINHPDSGELYRTRPRQYAICPKCGGKMSYGASHCSRHR